MDVILAIIFFFNQIIMVFL